MTGLVLPFGLGSKKSCLLGLIRHAYRTQDLSKSSFCDLLWQSKHHPVSCKSGFACMHQTCWNQLSFCPRNVKEGMLQIYHVASDEQLADPVTKAVSTQRLQLCRNKLIVRSRVSQDLTASLSSSSIEGGTSSNSGLEGFSSSKIEIESKIQPKEESILDSARQPETEEPSSLTRTTNTEIEDVETHYSVSISLMTETGTGDTPYQDHLRTKQHEENQRKTTRPERPQTFMPCMDNNSKTSDCSHNNNASTREPSEPHTTGPKGKTDDAPWISCPSAPTKTWQDNATLYFSQEQPINGMVKGHRRNVNPEAPPGHIYININNIGVYEIYISSVGLPLIITVEMLETLVSVHQRRKSTPTLILKWILKTLGWKTGKQVRVFIGPKNGLSLRGDISPYGMSNNKIKAQNQILMLH